MKTDEKWKASDSRHSVSRSRISSCSLAFHSSHQTFKAIQQNNLNLVFMFLNLFSSSCFRSCISSTDFDSLTFRSAFSALGVIWMWCLIMKVGRFVDDALKLPEVSVLDPHTALWMSVKVVKFPWLWNSSKFFQNPMMTSTAYSPHMTNPPLPRFDPQPDSSQEFLLVKKHFLTNVSLPSKLPSTRNDLMIEGKADKKFCDNFLLPSELLSGLFSLPSSVSNRHFAISCRNFFCFHLPTWLSLLYSKFRFELCFWCFRSLARLRVDDNNVEAGILHAWFINKSASSGTLMAESSLHQRAKACWEIALVTTWN